MSMACLIAVIFAAGVLALGCKKSGENAKESAQTNTYNYTYDKREVFIDDASADLTELGQRINELSDQTTAASASVKVAAQPKIEDLRKQRVALGKKLDALKASKEANWDELKADYQKTESQMKASLQESWQWVKNNTRS
jgi:hypothetical protein